MSPAEPDYTRFWLNYLLTLAAIVAVLASVLVHVVREQTAAIGPGTRVLCSGVSGCGGVGLWPVAAWFVVLGVVMAVVGLLVWWRAE